MEFERDEFEHYIDVSTIDETQKFRKGLIIGKNGACKACSYSSENCIVKGCKVHCSRKRSKVLWHIGKRNWYCHSYNNGEKK